MNACLGGFLTRVTDWDIINASYISGKSHMANIARRNRKHGSIAVVFGTRPCIIKQSPVIRALIKKKARFYIIHTGQHYTYNMERLFIESLGLPEPKYHLSVGSGTHAGQTADIIRRAEKVLLADKPKVVLVQGDTNTSLAVAIACAKLNDIKLGHVEAGLRSYDRTMPEEINRILADHASDILFAPTPNSKRLLLGEGISEEKIWMTGNTIVDAVRQNLSYARKSSIILSELNLEPGLFFLMTLHRQENVIDGLRLKGIVHAINSLADELDVKVIYPAHPRSLKNIKKFGITTGKRLRVIDPVGYFDFLTLLESSRLVLTDSGGVQEEACILNRPCVTLRENTERPETIEAGANCLGGIRHGAIKKAVMKMLSRNKKWQNPFGDGRAGERIADVAIKTADF